MNQIIKPESVDFNELVSNNTNKISINYQSKMIDILNKEFTEEQARWYIASLFMFINYHPTNEFPINLQILVELAGFSHKRNAKRTLENNFILDIDYKIMVLPKEQSSWGGSGSERIMLNTDTFKSMCMLVKTEKSKDIRLYYVKLENIYNKIVMEEMEITQKLLKEKELVIEIKNKELLQKDDDHIKNLELDKHNTLLYKFLNKFCIYLCKVGENLIKCGSTQDINIRKDDLKRVFGSCVFLDIFECTIYNFREVEQRVLCKVKKHLYKEPINNHISKEVVLLNDLDFNYNQLKTIVTNEIKNYTNKEVELITLHNHTNLIQNESKKLDLISDLSIRNFTFEQISQLINYTQSENQTTAIKVDKVESVVNKNIIQEIKVNKNKEKEVTHEIIGSNIVRKGRKIQLINPDNLNVIVKIYDSMVCALRDSEHDYSKISILKAAKNNTVYRNFRWMFVEFGDDCDTVKDIKPTIASRQSELIVVVQLNVEQTKIIDIYNGVTLIKNKFRTSLARLRKIIGNKLIFNNSYFIKIEDCSKELVDEYKKHNNISSRTNPKSVSVRQTNIHTNEQIIYKSIMESSIKFGSGEKTISNSIKNNTALNGYKFEYIK